MTEPKRRGRPPKSSITLIGPDDPAPHLSPVAAHVWVVDSVAAQSYAQRVWDGQGSTVPRAERLRRVAIALEGQGLSMEGVSL